VHDRVCRGREVKPLCEMYVFSRTYKRMRRGRGGDIGDSPSKRRRCLAAM